MEPELKEFSRLKPNLQAFVGIRIWKISSLQAIAMGEYVCVIYGTLLVHYRLVARYPSIRFVLSIPSKLNYWNGFSSILLPCLALHLIIARDQKFTVSAGIEMVSAPLNDPKDVWSHWFSGSKLAVTMRVWIILARVRIQFDAVISQNYYPIIYSISDSRPLAICSAGYLPNGTPVPSDQRTYSNSCTIKVRFCSVR